MLRLNIEQDTNELEKFNYSINSFTANYFFFRISIPNHKVKIFSSAKKNFFYIEVLLLEGETNLDSCLNIQENVPLKKIASYLLILNALLCSGPNVRFTMIDLLEHRFNQKYRHLLNFALFIAISGIVISLF